MEEAPIVLSIEWTHRLYVKDDEYIPHGEEIEAKQMQRKGPR
jgi:hypothetical protein